MHTKRNYSKTLNKYELSINNSFSSLGYLKKKEKKVCLNWLRWGCWPGIAKIPSNNNSSQISNNVNFSYSDFFWSVIEKNETSITNFSYRPSLSNVCSIVLKKKILLSKIKDLYILRKKKENKKVTGGSVYQDNVLRQILGHHYTETHQIYDMKSVDIQESQRFLKRKFLGLGASGAQLGGIRKLKIKSFPKFLNSKICKLNKNLEEYTFSKGRYLAYFAKDIQKKYIKKLQISKGFPASEMMKRTVLLPVMSRRGKIDFSEYILINQFSRHPASGLVSIRKGLIASTVMDRFEFWNTSSTTSNMYAEFYGMSWKYFKLKVESFFYKQLGVRLHIWFLNVWDIFLNGIDSQWQWFRYENKTTYFLTRKGQRFLIEGREEAKFYIRTMALTLTMVGGAKLFMDKVSLMMKNHRNNWAFVLHTTKSLRFCINFFWFRFFLNYKVSLQGKIGGVLRAAKKIFKKGNVTIENKAVAITYYRGFPVTRFGVYNLSFWLQYRIPTLIGKFDDLEYIDTMKVLLSMYSVPWLAERLAEIVDSILRERIYRIRLKVEQYNRRIRARHVLLTNVLSSKKSFFKHTKHSLDPIKGDRLKDMLLKKKLKKVFNKKHRRVVKRWHPFNKTRLSI